MNFFDHKKQGLAPVLMGSAMGLMMLWMLHGALTGEGAMGAGALVVFVGAHVVIAAVAILAVVFAARLSERANGWLNRLHRPSLRHVGLMLGSAALSAGAVHLIAHGFGGLV